MHRSVLQRQTQTEALCFVHTGSLCVTFFPFEFKTSSPGMQGWGWRGSVMVAPPPGGAPERASLGSLPQRICPLLPTASDHTGCLPPCLKVTLCPAPHPTTWANHRTIYTGVGQGWRPPCTAFPPEAASPGGPTPSSQDTQHPSCFS